MLSSVIVKSLKGVRTERNESGYVTPLGERS